MQKLFGVVAVAVLGGVMTGAFSPAAQAAPPGGGGTPVSIKTVAFNVLAPAWSHPMWYPNCAVPLLDANDRRALVLATLNSMSNVDFYALQETQMGENELLEAGLGNGFMYFETFHDDSYWASYITEDPPFARNGVALAVNSAKYDRCTFHDVSLTTGNHGAVAVCRHKTLNRMVRLASVHLDSDTGGRRGKEAKALADWFGSNPGNFVDIIGADFNADTNSGVIQQRIVTKGFIDVLRAVGIDENTHPFAVSYNDNSNYGNIDHVMARGASVTAVAGQVFSNGLWDAYPILPGSGEPNESARICENFAITGSDHFPIEGVISVTP